ncbi:hypothetical protein F5Y12DRAFT_716426 [Xylaria sp. FL1777]|nr:hypothetical protein F5Y12DRAFT_716426 [Xylaria sp. FL1777]
MKTRALLLVSLAVLGPSTALPESHLTNPGICKRAKGVYDVCDTEHSFIRCNGHDALLITDCIIGNSTYCRIDNGRGHCDGAAPPDLGGGGGGSTAYETGSSEAPSASPGPIYTNLVRLGLIGVKIEIRESNGDKICLYRFRREEVEEGLTSYRAVSKYRY